MNISNITIAFRVKVILGGIMLLVGIMGAGVLFQTELFWRNTKDLYEHPLHVRIAIDAFNDDVMWAYSYMKEYVALDDAGEQQKMLDELEARVTDTLYQFTVIKTLYLGPHRDIERLDEDLSQWKIIRLKTLELLRQGKVAESEERLRLSGIAGLQMKKLTVDLEVISHFALNRAERFYREAEKEKDRLRVQVRGFVALIFLLSLLSVHLLVRWLTLPLQELSGVIRQYRSGRLDARSRYLFADEIGVVARQFNEMGETIEREMNIRVKAEAEARDMAAKLAVANVEMESFSYSVAHDLRTPLRSMEGFSKILMETWADKLDLQAKDYLQRVRGAAAIMAKLIDDLLDLSKAGRKEMVMRPLDLSEITRKIGVELRAHEPQRTIELVIQDKLIVKGDENLMGIVMRNLLVNAWKFTVRHERARVEFGSQLLKGERVYFVRDDGAGIDMTYAHKLFRPFARLYAKDEFSGTGIGLSLVARIILRHHGRVWVESDGQDKGATVYFTLP